MKATLNPVTSRELRERFRRPRSVVFFTVWLTVVVGLGYLIYLLAREATRNTGFNFGGVAVGPTLGLFMLEALLILLLTAVMLVVPGMAATAIVGERERQTLQLLQVSQLSALQIVFGKLWSSLSYLLLMIAAVAPVLVVPVLFGGVDVGDVVQGLAAIILVSVTLGSIALAVSARARTTRGAVAGSYVLIFALAFGSFLLILGEIVTFRTTTNDAFGETGREVYAAWLNPYVGMVSFLDEPVAEGFGFDISTPFDPIDELLIRRSIGGQRDAVFNVAFDEDNFQVENVAIVPSGGRGPVWQRALVVYALLTALALYMATRAVQVPARRGRRRRAADASA